MVKTPQNQAQNVFPNIDVISDAFVCKRTQAKIAGKEGYFTGSVSKTTGLPSGYGVFETDTWIHCGAVLNGDFIEGGDRVSMNKNTDEFTIVQSKTTYSQDLEPVKLKKMKIVTASEVKNFFSKNSKNIAKVNERLNFKEAETDVVRKKLFL